jgi:hypothetical protein
MRAATIVTVCLVARSKTRPFLDPCVSGAIRRAQSNRLSQSPRPSSFPRKPWLLYGNAPKAAGRWAVVPKRASQSELSPSGTAPQRALRLFCKKNLTGLRPVPIPTTPTALPLRRPTRCRTSRRTRDEITPAERWGEWFSHVSIFRFRPDDLADTFAGFKNWGLAVSLWACPGGADEFLGVCASAAV